MEFAALIIFFLVYFGMILGSLPGLKLDRTGIALLGAIAFIGLQNISIPQLVNYIDFSALSILFSFMIISGQFYYSGFYTYVVERIGKWKLAPAHLLFVVIVLSGLLSAVLLNDIVCLAMTPLVIRICFLANLNPLPFLLGLACASNIGSGLTLVGNPQNLLIGQVLSINFAAYLKYSCVPCLIGLLVTWGIIRWQVKEKWAKKSQKVEFKTISFDLWQSAKGVGLIIILLCIFFFFDIPRDHVSLMAAGFLLLSRRMTSQKMLSFIDWQLLILFIGLFIVNHGFLETHAMDNFLQFLTVYNIDLSSNFWIFIITAILSNIVSNVPAVMLLLPLVQEQFGGSLLAMTSTLAGNMFLIGSIANLIVIAQAAQYGVKISWKKHLQVGLPITLITLGITAGWFYFLSVS